MLCKFLVSRLVLVCALAMVCASLAQGQLQDLFRITNGAFANHTEYHRVNLPPGKELVLADVQGPGKITCFYYTDDGHWHRDDKTGSMYPGLVLEVFWDNASQPSIRVPLWNYFGAFGRRTVDFQSLPIQINHYCYMSYLPMPFSKRARFVLVNDGSEAYARSVAYGIDYEKDNAFAAQPSRLHAAWSRSNPTRNGLHVMLDVRGRGQYVGNFLYVRTKYKGWWGEGNTIFDVDGKSWTHTPGTEDEYGSCWGFDHTYSYAYSGYILMDEGKNLMYRWYLANPVRFRRSLKVQIQDQRAEAGRQVPSQDDYTSVVFWYQAGAHAAPKLPSYAERVAPSRGAAYQPPR